MIVQHSDGIYFPREPPPWPSYGRPLRWTFSLSVSLVEEGFSLGKLRKSSESTTAVKQAT
jgi:hypothetical protein